MLLALHGNLQLVRGRLLCLLDKPVQQYDRLTIDYEYHASNPIAQS
ncbi:MAG TPA: hypothetical protein VFC46_01725 [Humisphaera sp.]|nr:hypothetical protein [Humisphaera sp.]